MGLEVLEGATKSAFKELVPAIQRAITKPAVLEAAERGTAENPTILKEAIEAGIPTAQRAKDVPFGSYPELRASMRATRPSEKASIPEWIQNAKTIIGMFFRRDPNLPKDVQEKLYNIARLEAAAKGKANLIIGETHQPLQRDAVWQAAKTWDYMGAKDNVAQALRTGENMIDNEPLEKWQAKVGDLEKEIGNDPEIAQTQANIRRLMDGLFMDGVNRGWIAPDRYLSDYTPMRKLYAIAEGLANQGGEDLRVRLIGAQMKRTSGGKKPIGGRETNMLLVLRDAVADHLEKVAKSEGFMDLMSDKTINMTEHFTIGDILPKGLSAYNPGTGMFGYAVKGLEQAKLDSFGSELGRIEGLSRVVTPGSYVVPTPIAQALKEFNGATVTHRAENAAVRAGKMMARWLTVYNPANTSINLGSDFALALMGLPGERAQPVGLLKAYPKSFSAAMKIAFSKKPVMMKINGQMVDVRHLVESEGLAESTFFHQVQNQQISDELSRLIPESDRDHKFVVADMLQRARLGVELAPRLAAGIEAFERTGKLSEFGRVGRDITLRYGPGGPAASKVPLIRFMSPFIQFVGLSTGRFVDMVNTPGSRGRSLGAIMAVPLAIDSWNTHSTEYKQVEESIPQSLRDQAHVVMPDPHDPWNKVLRDVTGKPVVFPMRLSVLEDVMRSAGLGNIGARARRVIEGRDTPQKFAQDWGQAFTRNLTNVSALVPGMISDLGDVRTASGRKITGMDHIMRYLPGTKPIIRGAQTGLDFGPGEGARIAAEELVGLHELPVVHKREHSMDVDLIAAKRRVSDARAALRKASYNEGRSAVKRARKELDDAKAELQRIAPVLKKEHQE